MINSTGTTTMTCPECQLDGAPSKSMRWRYTRQLTTGSSTRALPSRSRSPLYAPSARLPKRIKRQGVEPH
jgi:hypothetical protein